MTTKLIAGIIIGSAAALAIGYLMTDEGSELRKKIKKSGEGFLDYLCDTLDKGKEKVQEYAENAADEVNERMSGAAQEVPNKV